MACEGLVTIMRVGQCGQHRWRRWRGIQELAAAGQLVLASAVAEQSVVTDALEPIRQDVQQEAPDELVGVEGHDFLPVVVAVVFPAKGDAVVIDPGQPGVGDGDAVGIAGEIFEYVLRPAERRLGIDYPRAV